MLVFAETKQLHQSDGADLKYSNSNYTTNLQANSGNPYSIGATICFRVGPRPLWKNMGTV